MAAFAFPTNMSAVLVVLLSVPSMLLPLAAPSHTTARAAALHPQLRLAARRPLAAAVRMSSPEELSKRTVVQLKEQLRAVGLPVSGRKAELVDRLISAAAPATPPPEPAPPEIPMGLGILGLGVVGVQFELFPQLQKKFTAEELDTIAENAMSCIGDHWTMMPQCGEALWVLYKRVCDKDLDKLAEALLPENVAESREQIKRHYM